MTNPTCDHSSIHFNFQPIADKCLKKKQWKNTFITNNLIMGNISRNVSNNPIFNNWPRNKLRIYHTLSICATWKADVEWKQYSFTWREMVSHSKWRLANGTNMKLSPSIFYVPQFTNSTCMALYRTRDFLIAILVYLTECLILFSK